MKKYLKNTLTMIPLFVALILGTLFFNFHLLNIDAKLVLSIFVIIFDLASSFFLMYLPLQIAPAHGRVEYHQKRFMVSNFISVVASVIVLSMVVFISDGWMTITVFVVTVVAFIVTGILDIFAILHLPKDEF